MVHNALLVREHALTTVPLLLCWYIESPFRPVICRRAGRGQTNVAASTMTAVHASHTCDRMHVHTHMVVAVVHAGALWQPELSAPRASPPVRTRRSKTASITLVVSVLARADVSSWSPKP
eukprot:355371-Chlamydomonas_euryale.AAC.7